MSSDTKTVNTGRNYDIMMQRIFQGKYCKDET